MGLDTTELIRRLKADHGEKFDYAKVEYRGYHEPIILICRKHGEFQVTPKSALYSKTAGCDECRRLIFRTSQRLSTEEFIERACKVHGDAYLYDEVDYQGTKRKVTIVCPHHGPFIMNARRHLEGRGCRKCSFERLRSDRRMRFWDFVDRVVATHGARKYDYRLEGHVNSYSKIPIRCPVHGVFYQSVAAHIRGHGCSACAQSTGESLVRAVLVETDVEFAEQVRFPECRAKRSLPFDFYVPGHRLLIEFDGTQHFEPSERWGGEEKLAETKRNDEIKNRFAKDNDYALLRIPHWKKDEIQ